MRKPIDWHQPSETVAYPKITSADKVAMYVNVAKQRVYVLVNGKKAYTMYCSSGIDNRTPKGHFQIGTRGDHFYTPSEKMGANYWTAFYGTGYLFHSVPTDVNGHYLPKEAAKLGKEPASHGCIRLSIADAKWVNQTIPTGTPVVIS
ncbi:L,D-transpeptidase [Lacticaseibacillus camelliae]|nr:L,D-transpeptidase [Lacticaseibacillus camelliae]